MKLTGAQALVRCLEAERTAFAFGIVGGKLGPLLHALARTPSIRYVGVRHEACRPDDGGRRVRPHGSDGRRARRDGSGRTQPGVGHGRRVQQQPGRPRRSPPTSIGPPPIRTAACSWTSTAVPCSRRVTKWNAVVTDPRRMPELVRTAFREALTGRPGPVHLDIPHDVLAAEVDFADDEFDVEPVALPRAVDGPRPNRGRRRRGGGAARRGATRPLIVAGGGVVLAGAEAEVRELAARAARAGRSDADGARRDRDRQPALHRPRRPDRRSSGAAPPSSRPTSC